MAQNRYPSQRETWHPILACEEYLPGHWVMLDPYRRPYAMIDIIRRGDEVGYRVTDWAQESANRKVLGYFTNLRAAARHGHTLFIASKTPHKPHPLSGHDFTRMPGKANTPARTERD